MRTKAACEGKNPMKGVEAQPRLKTQGMHASRTGLGFDRAGWEEGSPSGMEKTEPSMTRKLLLSFCALLCCSLLPLQAQHELGLHFMRHTFQSTTTNPAFAPEEKLVLSLPGLRNNLYFTGPTYGDILSTNAEGRTIVDIDALIPLLDAENFIRDDLEIETIGAALRLGKVSIQLGHSLHYLAFLKYPKTLPQVIWQGNAQFIGETVPLGNDLQLWAYHELSLGLAFDLTENLTFGARAKALQGIAALSTDADHQAASLFTDDDVYQLTLSADYRLHSAGTFRYDSYRDFDLDFNFGNFSLNDLLSDNNGWAFDFGARYQQGNWELALSVLDLGGIDWSSSVTTYAAEGEYLYDGLDFSQALSGEEVNFDKALDTLEQIFQVNQTQEPFRTELSTKAYFSVQYTLHDRWTLGALYFHESLRGETFPAFALSAQRAFFGDLLRMGATYSLQKDVPLNFGLHATLRQGPLQAFAVTDNVLSLVQPDERSRFNARVGFALLLL